ncbi:MAG: hypothetical protein R2856_39405 [Caldilineaceae bacterium]
MRQATAPCKYMPCIKIIEEVVNSEMDKYTHITPIRSAAQLSPGWPDRTPQPHHR